MTIELQPEQERIVQEQLATGRFGSVEEVLNTALLQLVRGEREQMPSRNDAVRRRIDFARNRSVKLPPGEKIKDLVHEGQSLLMGSLSSILQLL